MKNTLVVFEWYATGTYTLPTFFRKRIWYYTSFKNLGWLWFRIFKTLCTILMCAKQTMKKNSSKLERTYKYILGHEVCTRHYYCYYCYYYGVDLLAREECVWKRESVCVGGERERESGTLNAITSNYVFLLTLLFRSYFCLIGPFNYIFRYERLIQPWYNPLWLTW